MANKYLDYEGLKTLWSQIEGKFVDNTELENSIKDYFKKEDVSMSYENGTIKLVVNGAERGSIDATPFIKDGMLDDVAVKTVIAALPEGQTELLPNQILASSVEGIAVAGDKVIEFVWNTGDSTTKVDYIKTTDIAVDPETSNTMVSETIPVAGGPLASLLNAKGINSISKDTSMQDLLFTLFCEEQWPNPAAKYSYDTLYSVMSAPTGSYSNNDKVVEFGSTQSIGTITGKKAGYGNSSSSKQNGTAPRLVYDNFTWGYLDAEGKGTATSSESNPASKSATVTTNDVTYTLSRAYTNFGGAPTEGNSTTGADGSTLTFAAQDLTAKIGENKVVYTLSVSGQVHSATVADTKAYYAMSNLGNTNKLVEGVSTAQQKVDATATKTFTPSPATPASTSLTYKCYGVYPVYTNVGASSNTAAVETKVIGTTKDQKSFEVIYKEDSVNPCSFMYPSDRTCTVQIWNSTFNKWEAPAASNQKTETTETKVNNVAYNKWTYTGNALGTGAKFTFTLSKKISE